MSHDIIFPFYCISFLFVFYYISWLRKNITPKIPSASVHRLWGALDCVEGGFQIPGSWLFLAKERDTVDGRNPASPEIGKTL